MAEYLAPGVYVEETSFRAKSIEGVSTSTAGFAGPARYGPAGGAPELITSFPEFERVFGGLDRLDYAGDEVLAHNYLAQGVRAFFDNGGRRVYIARIFGMPEPPEGGALDAELQAIVDSAGRASNGSIPGLLVRARFPGRAGDCRVAFRFQVGGNVLAVDRDPASGDPFNVLRGISPDDVVWIGDPASPPGGLPTTGTLARARRFFDEALGRSTWRFDAGGASPPVELEDLTGEGDARDSVHRVSVAVEVTFLDRLGRIARQERWDDMGFEPGARNSIMTVFDEELPSRSQELRTPISISTDTLDNGPDIAAALLAQLGAGMEADVMAARDRRFEIPLTGGSDGMRPTAADYAGRSLADGRIKTGLLALEDITDIAIVAAPGYSAGGNASDDGRRQTQAVSNALVSHAERMMYRIAVLDSSDGQSPAEVRAQRAQLDSSHAALYYPWIRALDPVTEQEVLMPPSGYVSGIFARNDVEKGVHKAPANEIVRGALGFEVSLSKGQQDVLNPEGINCFRFFEGRGNRLWGARTISSDPEWKYVNLRRYFAYLERSIERGTQWVVFENNGDSLWANVRRTIEDFLFSEWKQDRLLGEKPDHAFFVRCDRSTMTQNDLDNGRLVCLIGVAPLRPAEFVIFRIGQWTGDRKA